MANIIRSEPTRWKRSRGGVDGISAIETWRHLRRPQFDEATVSKTFSALSGIAWLREPRWSRAVEGDAAAAIGLAGSLLPTETIVPQVDLAMSALCLVALAGDAAAELFMAFAVHSVRGGDALAHDIARSWRSRRCSIGEH